MAVSIRVTRDKRGYDHIQLVETVRQQGQPHSRILYWFRTPPGVRVGREPLDEETIRSIEACYPRVTFDWPRIFRSLEGSRQKAAGTEPSTKRRGGSGQHRQSSEREPEEEAGELEPQSAEDPNGDVSPSE